MKKLKGSITIFLSIIFMSFALLTLVFIEYTKIHVGQNQGERALISSMQSILGAYNTRLKEDYGLMARSSDLSTIKKEAAFYLDKNICMDNDINDSKSMFQQKATIQNVKVNGTLMNQDIFRNQLVEYMKYRLPEQFISSALNQVGILRQASNSADLLKRKKALDKEMKMLDAKYISLIRNIEGIDQHNHLSNTFVKQIVLPRKDYICKIPNAYVKQNLINKRVALEEYRIRFSKLKGVASKISDIKSIENDIDSLESDISDLRKDIKSLEDDKMPEDEKNQVSNSINDSIDDAISRIESRIDDKENSIDNLCDEIRAIEKELEAKLGYEFDDLQEEITKENNKFTELISSIKYNNKNSYDCAESITNQCKNLLNRINSLEEVMTKQKENYDPKIINNLESDLRLMKARIDMNSEGDSGDNTSLGHIYNSCSQNAKLIDEYEGILSKSNNIISDIFNHYDPSIDKEIENYTNNIKNIENNIHAKYVIDINFDFFNGEKKPNNNKKIKKGITQAISQKPYKVEKKDKISKVLEKDLPSYVREIKKQELQKCEDDNWLEQLAKASRHFIDMKELKNQIYINEYILNNFSTLSDQIAVKEGTCRLEDYKEEGFLKQEVEYILAGYGNERKNVNVVETKIIILRTALNLIHIYSDADKTKITWEAATAISSWWSGGLATFFVQATLNGLWALAEAKIDYDMLIEGKNIPLIKQKDDWHIGFNQVVDMTKSKNANANKEDKKSNKDDKHFIQYSYNNYLKIFLFLQNKEIQTSRMQDLIQLNMITRYNENFKIKNQMTDFTIEAEVALTRLFNVDNSKNRYFKYFLRQSLNY